MKRGRLFWFMVIAGVTVIGLVQCTSSSIYTPATEKSEPTLATDGDFDCWTESRKAVTPPSHSDQGQLIVGYGVIGDVYRREVTTPRYSLMVSSTNVYRGSPSVSPNARYMWYSASFGNLDQVVYVYDLVNGTQRQTPFRGGAWPPSVNWSADGQCLIGWNFEVATAYRLTDGATQQKTFPAVVSPYEGTQAVSPSPNGHWWAWPCAGKGGICVAGSDGKEVHNQGFNIPQDLDKDSQMSYRRGLLSWSPTSEILAFAYATRYYVADIHLRLIHFSESQSLPYEDFNQNVDDLRWSPDGNHLLILDYNSIKLYDTESRKISELLNLQGDTKAVMPAWSPNSKRIAFVDKDRKNIYTMNIDGTDIREVPSLPLSATHDSAIHYIYWIP